MPIDPDELLAVLRTPDAVHGVDDICARDDRVRVGDTAAGNRTATRPGTPSTRERDHPADEERMTSGRNRPRPEPAGPTARWDRTMSERDRTEPGTREDRPEDPTAEPTRIRFTDDGPALVEGPVELITPDGTTIRSDRFLVAVCLCKRSRTYPLCDTSHRRRRRTGGARPAPTD